MKKYLALFISVILMLQTIVVFGNNTPFFFTNFTGYEGGTAIHDELIAIDGAGYLDAITIDTEHGTSLKLGRGTTDDGAGNTYIGIPVNTSEKRKVSFAFNMNSESTGGQAYDINLRDSGGKAAYIGMIEDGNIVLMSKDDGVTAGATIPYEAGKWYKLDLIVEGVNRAYTFILTKPDGTKVTVPGTLRSGMGTNINLYRIFAPGYTPAAETYMAIDDIVVTDGNENMSPIVNISGIDNNGSYCLDDLPTALITATDDGYISKIELYVDDQIVAEIEDSTLSYNFADISVGNHAIDIVAIDDLGLSTIITYNIKILLETPPEIFVTGIEDGGSYSFSDLATVTITATSNSGVRCISVYIDGELSEYSADDNMNYDLSMVPAGTHELLIEAESINGTIGNKLLEISIVSDNDQLTYSYDFENYSSNSIPQGMTGIIGAGYMEAINNNDEYGTSIELGYRSSTSTGTGDTYFAIPLDGAKEKVSVDFDIMVNSGSTGFAMVIRGDKGMTYISEINNGIFVLAGNPQKNVSVTENQWYHLHYVGDATTKDYEIVITDKEGNVVGNSEGSKLSSSSGTAQNLFRIHSPSSGSVASIVVDNIEVKQVVEFPELFISSPIDNSEQSFDVVSSKALKTEDLSKNNVKLYDEFGEVALKSVICTDGFNIQVCPKNQLRSNHNYKVQISSEVRYELGIKLGATIESRFKTTAAKLDVLSGKFNYGKFIMNATNETGSAKPVTVVIQKWDANNKIVFAQAVMVTINPGQNNYDIAIPSVSNSEKVSVYLWNGLVSPKPITSKVWILQ